MVVVVAASSLTRAFFNVAAGRRFVELVVLREYTISICVYVVVGTYQATTLKLVQGHKSR